MNGYSILNEAARLCGLDFAEEKIKIMGLTLLNTALADMGLSKTASLSHPLKIKGVKEAEAVKFCLAALVANSVGEIEAAENMSQIYLRKKGELMRGIGRVKDTMPRGEW